MTDIATKHDDVQKPIIGRDKDIVLAEENPFEAMMERFDHAAKLLNLDRGLYKPRAAWSAIRR